MLHVWLYSFKQSVYEIGIVDSYSNISEEVA